MNKRKKNNNILRKAFKNALQKKTKQICENALLK